MLGVTLFGIFLTPVFFYVIRWLGDRLSAYSGDKAHEKPGGHLTEVYEA
jgi:hypothetical protein